MKTRIRNGHTLSWFKHSQRVPSLDRLFLASALFFLLNLWVFIKMVKSKIIACAKTKQNKSNQKLWSRQIESSSSTSGSRLNIPSSMNSLFRGSLPLQKLSMSWCTSCASLTVATTKLQCLKIYYGPVGALSKRNNDLAWIAELGIELLLQRKDYLDWMLFCKIVQESPKVWSDLHWASSKGKSAFKETSWSLFSVVHYVIRMSIPRKYKTSRFERLRDSKRGRRESSDASFSSKSACNDKFGSTIETELLNRGKNGWKRAQIAQNTVEVICYLRQEEIIGNNRFP